MPNQIIVPSLGESVTEATVSKWLKQVGDSVDSDEPLVELETDKVNVEVPSPSNGVLEKIAVKEGDTVQVGALLGSVSDNDLKAVDKPKQKKYTPPKQEEKTIQLYEEKKEELKKVSKNKTANGQEPLVLNEEESQPALILEEEHKEEKPKVSKISKSASPSAK